MTYRPTAMARLRPFTKARHNFYLIITSAAQQQKSLMISGTIQIHRITILKPPGSSMPRTAFDPSLSLRPQLTSRKQSFAALLRLQERSEVADISAALLDGR